MNKQQITDLLATFPLSEKYRKSVANRIESALSKTGTPAQLLHSASSSLKRLAEDTPNTPDYGAIVGIATALDFAREIVNAGKESAKKEKREFWAETQEEALALKAKAEATKTPAKPKKSKASAVEPVIEPELAEAIRGMIEALARR